MPELPEVETIANGLNKRVAGDVIEAVWIGSRVQPLKSPAQEMARVLEGARLERVRRVGKHIVADLTESKRDHKPRAQWVIHLGMTGQMLVAQPQSEIQ